jgi:N-acetylneuraminic acid mutarotase
MKTPTNNFFGLMRINIKSYPNFSGIISLALFLFVVLILGGVSTCFAQSPWTQKADMQNVRQGHSSGVLDGMIYVIGGVQYNTPETHYNAIKSMEFYDPDLDSWTSKADMNTGRIQFPTCVFDGKIYAIGGGQSVYWDPLESIEVYDPGTDTWIHVTNIPTARMGHTASLVNGKIYIIGGADSNDMNPLAEVDVYDPLTNTWDSTKADLPTPRLNLQAVVLNGKIYAIGGHRGPAGEELGLTTVEEYDPETDNWTTKADMIWPRKYFTACALNEKIYVFGGASGACESPLSNIEEYDPATDTWMEGSPIPTKWVMAAAAPFNGKVYISGGTYVICPPSVRRTLRTYIPHHDLLPLIEKTEVDKGYAKPAIESVCITTKMRDTTGITLMAKILLLDQTPVDSLQLFDDGNHNDGNAGDSLYANVWLVSSPEERQYYVDLKVKRVAIDTVINQFNNMALFTTIGPVTFEDYTFTGTDTEPNPGDRLRLYLSLKNNSTVATATNLGARLISLDTLVSISDAIIPLGNIAAGEDSTFEKIFVINISEKCPVNTQIPILVEITSNGYKYWGDTFSILVQEPSNIEEIREPITRIYPNPTDNILNIEISNTGAQGLKIEILSITGTLIYQKEFTSSGAHFVEQLDLSGYAKGIYLVKVRMVDTVYFEKVVVR